MVILYTIDCPKCKVLEKKLIDGNIPFERFDDREAMIRMGLDEMPVLEVDGKKMDFSKAVKWAKEARTA